MCCGLCLAVVTGIVSASRISCSSGRKKALTITSAPPAWHCPAITCSTSSCGETSPPQCPSCSRHPACPHSSYMPLPLPSEPHGHPLSSSNTPARQSTSAQASFSTGTVPPPHSVLRTHLGGPSPSIPHKAGLSLSVPRPFPFQHAPKVQILTCSVTGSAGLCE